MSFHNADQTPVPPPPPEYSPQREAPIPDVNPTTAHYHLSILRLFCSLYDLVESQAATDDDKAHVVNTFLVCAEARYIRYLTLLNEIVDQRDRSTRGVRAHKKELDPNVPFTDVMPLPPWDVAIIFHVHCLSPFRYYADMEHLSLWNVSLAFPLERLHDLIERSNGSGIWSDVESEQLWNHRFRDAPYQLWNTNPFHGGTLHLQNVHMTCPTCDKAVVFDLHQFTAMHVTKKSTILIYSLDRMELVHFR